MNLGFGGGGSEFQIPVLSAIVGMIADLMRIGLQICYEFTSGLGFPNYVIAIVVLTIPLRRCCFPRGETDPFHESDAGNTAEIQKIQKKYRNDPAMMRREMGRLYKEHNASPMAGCLPLLIQMPFLIAMYYAIQGFNYDPLHAGFLWIESLAAEDGTYILPVLSAASTFLVSWQTTPKDAPGNQKTMLFMMPLMIGWMSLHFPSGLVIYWVVSNIYQFFSSLSCSAGKGKEMINGPSKKA
ncbi:MAG: YidC/Oxa1 family membrane protein insertase [Dialister invisus]